MAQASVPTFGHLNGKKKADHWRATRASAGRFTQTHDQIAPMSGLTILLAKLLGLYCVIVAVTMMVNRRTMIDAAHDLVRSPPSVLLAGVIAVGVGLGVVIGHNVWSGGALPVVVTISGWVSLIKGVVLLALPQGQMAKLYEAIRYERYYLAYVGVTLALGLYLTIAAFTA
jgi:hypothetical protein